MEKTYILTAEIDDENFVWLDGLRREHFPPERNFLSAHLTLFHRLSSIQIARLRSLHMTRAAIEVHFDRVISLGFGVAIHVRSAELERLRSEARTHMGGVLSRQDSQAWNPHVTIQNKVSAESAKKLKRSLEAELSLRRGAVSGLAVWEYLGGPWGLVERIAFSDGAHHDAR
jgi:hypothetical protein